MGFGALRAQTLDLNFYVHGVDATVRRPVPDQAPITTTVVWVTPITDDAPNSGGRLARREPRRIACLRRSVVPTVPVGTEIVAPEQDGAADKGWRVEGLDRLEADHTRVVVVEDPAVLGP